MELTLETVNTLCAVELCCVLFVVEFASLHVFTDDFEYYSS